MAGFPAHVAHFALVGAVAHLVLGGAARVALGVFRAISGYVAHLVAVVARLSCELVGFARTRIDT